MRYAEVLLPLNFGDGTFTYSIPEQYDDIKVGVRVRVMLRRKEMVGVVFSLHDNVPSYRVNPILEQIDSDPLMTVSQMSLVKFASEYYADSIGNIFKALLPSRIRDEAFSGVMVTAYRFSAESLETELNNREKKKAQYRVLMIFADTEKTVLSRKDLIRRGAGEKTIKDLCAQGVLEKTELPRDKYESVLDGEPSLRIQSGGTEEMKALSDQILRAGKPCVVSGILTEETVSLLIFLSLESMRDGKQILVMLPSRNEKIVRSLKESLEGVVTYFQAESTASRTKTYLRMLNSPESVSVVVGGRMSPLLPLCNLGQIVVIDEHDERYRGFRSPYFNARDMAILLSRQSGANLLMVSSSPSVETVHAIREEKYSHLTFVRPSRIKVLEKGTDLLSKYSRMRMAETLSRGKKVLVFQNRRGYAGHVQCSSCGDIPGCPRCSVSLSLHASERVLKCHCCGYVRPYTGKCDVCSSDVYLVQGYGTERLASTLTEMFPDAGMTVLDSDSRNDFNPKAGIIVGTSYMIRHESVLQNIGLVLAANADNLLYSTDFRVTEKAFRTMMTLRSIAMENDAELIVQTKDYRKPVFKCLDDGDCDAFYLEELRQRQEMNYPPFCRIVRLEMRAGDDQLLHSTAEQLRNRLDGLLRSELPQVQVSPVFEPEIDKVNMQYIVLIVLRFPKSRQGLQSKQTAISILNEFMFNMSRKISVTVEVDPQ